MCSCYTLQPDLHLNYKTMVSNSSLILLTSLITTLVLIFPKWRELKIQTWHNINSERSRLRISTSLNRFGDYMPKAFIMILVTITTISLFILQSLNEWLTGKWKTNIGKVYKIDCMTISLTYFLMAKKKITYIQNVNFKDYIFRDATWLLRKKRK